jgi:hypothetical protein
VEEIPEIASAILSELRAAGAALTHAESSRDAAVIQVRHAVESAVRAGVRPAKALDLLSLGPQPRAHRTARAIVRQITKKLALRRRGASPDWPSRTSQEG